MIYNKKLNATLLKKERTDGRNVAQSWKIDLICLQHLVHSPLLLSLKEKSVSKGVTPQQSLGSFNTLPTAHDR